MISHQAVNAKVTSGVNEKKLITEQSVTAQLSRYVCDHFIREKQRGAVWKLEISGLNMKDWYTLQKTKLPRTQIGGIQFTV